MKKLLLGVAVTAAMFGTTAHAVVAPTTYVDATTGLGFNISNNTPAVSLAGNLATVLYLSGSSALNPVIEAALTEGSANAVCKAGTLVKYTDIPSSGSDQAAYYCKLNTANTKVSAFMTANGGKPNLLLFKRNAGGSLMGVNGVIKALKQEFLNLTTTNTTVLSTNPTTVTGCSSVTAGTGFAKAFACSYSANPAGTFTGGNNTTIAPSFGVSDVTPNIFTAASENAPAGTLAFTLTGISVVPATAQTFGIVVTTSLRNALQEAQFGKTSTCVTDTTAKETADCMPNLNSNQVAELLAGYPAASNAGNTITVNGQGKIASWKQLKVGTSNLYDFATTKPASDTVHICGRTIGSGTKAVTGAVFLGNGCKATAQSNIMAQNFNYKGISEAGQADYLATAQAESSTRPTVHAMGASGDLAECLNELNSGDATALSAGNFAPGATVNGSRWAIGYISLDRNDKDASKGYKVVKIDGAAPTLTNVANGSYPFWMESVYLYKTATPTTSLGLIQELVASFGKPAILKAVNNAKSNYPWGLSGNMAVPNTTNIQNLDGTVNTDAPVNPMSYAIYPGTSTATATDDCRNPLVYSNTTGIANGTATGAINTDQGLVLVK